jgi:hypothetical protein
MIVHLDHPNAQQVRRTAIALGGLLHEVVFVGGQMVPFFITDRGLHRLRPTDDVDVIVECRTRHDYHEFAQRLHALGFRPDQSPGAPICRYRTADGLVLDAMPLDGDILGFSNRWYPLVMLIAGRAELANELHLLTPDVRAFIADSARMLRAAPWFDDVLEGTLPDAQRLPAILEGVRARIDRLMN